jgi:hypothetical protein
MRIFLTKFVEKINFFAANRAVCEIMWNDVVQPDRPQMAVRRMRIACRIPKATNTHSQYVLLIAFPLQQWLHEALSATLQVHFLSCCYDHKEVRLLNLCVLRRLLSVVYV